MAREEIKDHKGRVLGVIEDKGNELLLLDPTGRRKARFDKAKNQTYDASGSEVGKGNLLMKLVQQSQGESQTAKSSFTARSRDLKATPQAAQKPGAAKPGAPGAGAKPGIGGGKPPMGGRK